MYRFGFTPFESRPRSVDFGFDLVDRVEQLLYRVSLDLVVGQSIGRTVDGETPENGPIGLRYLRTHAPESLTLFLVVDRVPPFADPVQLLLQCAPDP